MKMERFNDEFFTGPLTWNLSPDQYVTLCIYLTLSVSTSKFPPKDRLPQTKKKQVMKQWWEFRNNCIISHTFFYTQVAVLPTPETLH